MISRINDIEVERYMNLFENSYMNNFNHSKKKVLGFPRESIISGYYAMHDITELLFAKKFRIKVDYEAHKTAIILLMEPIKIENFQKCLKKNT